MAVVVGVGGVALEIVDAESKAEMGERRAREYLFSICKLTRSYQ